MNTRLEIVEIARHRNGVSGEPFYAVRFTIPNETLVAVVFEQPGHVAVLNAELAATTVAFGVTSYRGDWFERPLRRAIAKWERDRSTPTLCSACDGTAPRDFVPTTRRGPTGGDCPKCGEAM